MPTKGTAHAIESVDPSICSAAARASVHANVPTIASASAAEAGVPNLALTTLVPFEAVEEAARLVRDGAKPAVVDEAGRAGEPGDLCTLGVVDRQLRRPHHRVRKK